jgi:hypothetical protein
MEVRACPICWAAKELFTMSKHSATATPTHRALARSADAGHIARSAADVQASSKETAASFTYREFQEIVDRMTIASNRLSAAKKRLQEHFGLPVSDSACASDPTSAVQPGMDGVRTQLDSLDGRFQSIASGIEELV